MGARLPNLWLQTGPASDACCLSDSAILSLWFGDLHGSDYSAVRLRREENQRREGEDMSHSLLSRSKCLLVAAVMFLLLRFDALRLQNSEIKAVFCDAASFFLLASHLWLQGTSLCLQGLPLRTELSALVRVAVENRVGQT